MQVKYQLNARWDPEAANQDSVFAGESANRESVFTGEGQSIWQEVRESLDSKFLPSSIPEAFQSLYMVGQISGQSEAGLFSSWKSGSQKLVTNDVSVLASNFVFFPWISRTDWILQSLRGWVKLIITVQ